MKSNFIIILTVFTLASVFCLPKATWGQSSCQSGIYLEKVVKTERGQDTGAISVNIKTSGAFECNLYRVSGSGYELVKTIRGSNNQLVEFEDLPPFTGYSVAATFYAEDNFLCRKRQLNDLSTLE